MRLSNRSLCRLFEEIMIGAVLGMTDHVSVGQQKAIGGVTHGGAEAFAAEAATTVMRHAQARDARCQRCCNAGHDLGVRVQGGL